MRVFEQQYDTNGACIPGTGGEFRTGIVGHRSEYSHHGGRFDHHRPYFGGRQRDYGYQVDRGYDLGRDHRYHHDVIPTYARQYDSEGRRVDHQYAGDYPHYQDAFAHTRSPYLSYDSRLHHGGYLPYHTYGHHHVPYHEDLPSYLPSMRPHPFHPSRPSFNMPSMPLQNLGCGPQPLFGWDSVAPLQHTYGQPSHVRHVKPDYRRFCYSVGKAEVPYASLPGGPLQGFPTPMSSMLV